MLVRRRWRAAITAASVLAVVGLVAIAAIVPKRFVWCAGLGEMHLSCCCPQSDEDVVRAPCCDARELATVLSSSAVDHVAPIAPPAEVVGWVLPTAPSLELAEPRPRTIDARAGPRLRPHARCSVYLI